MKKKMSGLTKAGLVIAILGAVLSLAAAFAVFLLYKQDVKSIVDFVENLKDVPFAKAENNVLLFGGILAILFIVIGTILAVRGKKKSMLTRIKNTIPKEARNAAVKAYTYTENNKAIVIASAVALIALCILGRIMCKRKEKKKKKKNK